jgi:hypothetical protein
MKKNILIFGLIAGLIIGVLMQFSLWLGNKNPDYGHSLITGYATMVLGFALIFVGVKNFRDKYNQGSIGFGKAFRIGLGITLIASTIYVIFWLVDYYVFMPDFMDKYADQMIKLARESSVSPADLSKKMAEINNMKESYKNPVMVVLWTYLEVVPVGLVISLLTALFLKRRRRPAKMPAVA